MSTKDRNVCQALERLQRLRCCELKFPRQERPALSAVAMQVESRTVCYSVRDPDVTFTEATANCLVTDTSGSNRTINIRSSHL